MSNAFQTVSLLDALLGIASQVEDVAETIGLVLGVMDALVGEAGGLEGPGSERYAELHQQFAMALANAEGRAERLQRSLAVCAALRAEIEGSSVGVNRKK